MNPLQDDQTATPTGNGHGIVAILESHDIGAPCMILTRGFACDSYSARTIDVFGEKASAEW